MANYCSYVHFTDICQLKMFSYGKEIIMIITRNIQLQTKMSHSFSLLYFTVKEWKR